MFSLTDKRVGFPLIIAILFIEGFAGLSYQMMYIRQLTPVIGNNITIVSWIVGVFLLFLAIGYRQGGIFTGHVEKRLTRNFLISAFISGIGLSTLFVMTVFKTMIEVVGHYEFLIFYAFLIVAPTSFLLGQTVPLLTNKMPEEGVSRVSGDVLFLSTIGSFLGSVLGTNILVHYLGVAQTIFLVTLSIIVLACLLQKRAFIFAIIFVPFLYLSTIHYESQYYINTNEYSSFRVEQTEHGKMFQVNESYSSYLGNDGEEYGYIAKAKRIAFDMLDIKDSDILTIGAGGFIFSRNIPDNDFTYVDIDPEMQKMAEQYFLEEPINGEFIGQDARSFLLKNDKQYDSIFLDAYVSRFSIPQHLSTVEFFRLIKDNLKDDGIFMINSITSTRFDSEFAKTFHDTINMVFPYCYTFPDSFTKDIRMNLIYVCFNSERIETPYTDNYNHSNTDFWKTIVE